MSDEKTCTCSMFKMQSTCYHVGYKPVFREGKPAPFVPTTPAALASLEEAHDLDVPRAIQRMRQWNREHANRKWPS